MSARIISFLLFACIIIQVQAQPDKLKTKFDSKWQALVGEWVSDNEGDATKGTGNCSFRFDLQQNILIRRNHADLPAGGARPGGAHDDLMVIYPAAGAANQSRAMYFDDEGHVIDYSGGWSADGATLTLTSKASPGAPQYRLLYTKIDGDKFTVSFEIAPPNQPNSFKQYVSGKIKRTKAG